MNVKSTAYVVHFRITVVIDTLDTVKMNLCGLKWQILQVQV